MTEELIMNDINMLDPRLIGEKFYVLSNHGEWLEDVLVDVDPLNNRAPHIFQCRHGLWWEHIRLAQGEEVVYDGKGQPLPDGVKVGFLTKLGTQGVLKAELVQWESVVTFQIQEQPVKWVKPVKATKVKPPQIGRNESESHCPTCGSAVIVSSSDEGTGCYMPICSEEQQDTRLKSVIDKIDDEISDVTFLPAALRNEIIQGIEDLIDYQNAELSQCSDLLHYPSFKRNADSLEKEVAKSKRILEKLGHE